LIQALQQTQHLARFTTEESDLSNLPGPGKTIAMVIVLTVLLGAAGVAMWVRADGGPMTLAVSSTLIGIALIVVSLRSVIAWGVTYKGHATR